MGLDWSHPQWISVELHIKSFPCWLFRWVDYIHLYAVYYGMVNYCGIEFSFQNLEPS